MDMNQYLEIFIDESRENLQEMNSALLSLEKNPNNMELLDEIFRIAHTLKGMAGTMGYSKIADLTHKMENGLHKVRDEGLNITGKLVDVLFECFDALDEYVENLISIGDEGELNPQSIINKLDSIIAGKKHVAPEKEEKVVAEADKEEVSTSEFHIEMNQSVKKIVNKALSSALNVFKINVILDEKCMLKSARSFIVFNKLEDLGEIIASYPEPEKIEDEQFDLNFELLYITKLDDRTVEKEIMGIAEISDVVIEMIDEKFKNIVITEEKEEKVVSSKSKKKKKTKAKKKSKPGSNKIRKRKTSKTVRVDIDRLDNLMNLVSELIIIKTRLEDVDSTREAKQKNMHETIEYLERITTSLHDAVMKVRMVPVERTFNRFPRLVRDLSKELGKKIKLSMSGEETEVDRTVIDEIGDPLIHLIRNSIDHGIESPEERLELNKSEEGSVNLRAYPDGNTVVIEVEDDGGGIDGEKVKETAVEKGVITQEEAELMERNEAINLLFEPGFSTAKEVTDLSGRGVGLDVVRSKIESLNGTVEVKSELGKGSKFIIRLPLTLAIIQALMIKLNQETYAIPLSDIKEITTLKASDISFIQDQEVILYRGNTLPLIKLGDKLNVEYAEDKEESKELTTVVIRKGEEEAGVVVDTLLGQQEIVIKSLGEYLRGVKLIAGATILGNGGVALIVDPSQLFEA